MTALGSLPFRRGLGMMRPVARQFHSTRRAFVKIGDTLPDVELMENSPGNKVNVRKEIGSKGVIVGVPAAFSPACSATHVPGFVNSQKLKDAGNVFVVSVNDPFVMKAWGQSLDPSGKVRFLADPSLALTNELDLAFDASAIFGGPRSKRYALRIEDGKVKAIHVEPDNTGVKESIAEKVLQ